MMLEMPARVDDQGNIWMHGREGGTIFTFTAEDTTLDASTWTVVFRTSNGFEKTLTAAAAAKTLQLDLTEEDVDQFPLTARDASVDAGMLYALMDETVPTMPVMLLQGYIARFGFE